MKISDKFYGNYRAIVIANDLDEYGRIRVRVPSIHGDDVPDKALPVATFADPLMGGSPNEGGYFIPSVGGHVWVFFENGDHRYPVYFAGAPNATSFPDERKADGVEVAKNRVFKTAGGHLLELDDSGGAEKVTIKHSGGTTILLDHEGNIKLTAGGEEGQVQIEAPTVIANGVDILELRSALIKLGEGAEQPSVLGETLLEWLAGHTHGSSNGATSAPLTAPPNGALSKVVQVE